MQLNAHICSDLTYVTFALDEFDGACDPAFDNDLDELERQFAELRLGLANGFN